MSLAARQQKGRPKGVPDSNPANRRPAWKTQSYNPGSRTSTPPAANAGPPNGQGFPPLNAAAPPDAKPAGDLNGASPNGTANPSESFRTDTEISQTGTGPRAQRELQAWQAPSDAPSYSQTLAGNGGAPRGDDLTFGPGASSGSWDQFVANEQMFGVTTSFDEDVYTTKLDRNHPDFKERERKAQQIANEIIGATSNNPHLAEERNQNDDSGVNEEDKYGAVVRSANAYVPPGARKPTSANGNGSSSAGTPAEPAAAAATGSKPDVPKVKINVPDDKAAKAGGDNLVGTFRDFMATEKKRLEQKRQAIVKNEIDKRVADLVKFSQTFKLNKPIPDDLVPILAKDEAKQAAIREKSEKDASSNHARAIGPSTTTSSTNLNATPALAPTMTSSSTNPNVSAAGGSGGMKPSASVASRLPATKDAASRTAAAGATPTVKPVSTSGSAKKPAVSMVIQKIPPFNPEKARLRQQQAAAAAAASPASPTADSAKLNVNAPSFKPGSAAVSPSSTAAPSVPAVDSPKAKAVDASPSVSAAQTTNPFFGTRPTKKPATVHIKDDFNPFKFAKVVEANQISALWPYNGKRFMLSYPAPPPPPPNPPAPHIPPPVAGPPPPPPPYEEDAAAQQARAAASTGYMVYYPQYYPGQYMHPPPQPMMPGAPGAPPPPQGYIPAGFVPHMYPAPMPHGAHGQPMYPPPHMAGMPPPQPYMPPPGAYATPNGAPPGSMPPTPMPAHAYYHAPQFGYPMMMAPPPQQGQPRPPHPYEGAPPQPGVPMPGQVSHQ